MVQMYVDASGANKKKFISPFVNEIREGSSECAVGKKEVIFYLVICLVLERERDVKYRRRKINLAPAPV